MIESKGWNWKIVDGKIRERWMNPSIESFYLLSRWYSQGKRKFLDLGCGLGRHSILFGKNGFEVSCFDISEEAIKKTSKWAIEEGLNFDYSIGDCVLCFNVISHTDTEGMKVIANEIKRILKKDRECYLTLGSKDTWGFKQTQWPLVDENTRLKMEEGPEYKTPHFYADYNLIKQLFKDFEIEDIFQVIDYYTDKDKLYDSYHYHVLIKKK